MNDTPPLAPAPPNHTYPLSHDEFMARTKTIRAWVNGEGVSVVALHRELVRWTAWSIEAQRGETGAEAMWHEVRRWSQDQPARPKTSGSTMQGRSWLTAKGYRELGLPVPDEVPDDEVIVLREDPRPNGPRHRLAGAADGGGYLEAMRGHVGGLANAGDR